MGENKAFEERWTAIILVFFGTVLTGLIALSELDTCRRVASLFATIFFAVVALIYQVWRMKAKNELPESFLKKYPSDAVIRIVSVVSIVILIVCLFWVVFPDQNPFPGCQASMPPSTPTPFTTPMFPLSDARVEFIITFSDGSQIKIPADGILTLAANDKVVVRVSVSNIDHSPFPHELLYKYYSASGKNVDGDTMSYIAKQADIITVWITDKVLRDEIFRNMRVVIK